MATETPLSSPPPSFSRSHRWREGLSVGVSVLAVLALVVMANYLASRHYTRWHWADHARTSLSPYTLGVLQGVTNPVQVVVFFDASEPLYSSVTALLAEYQAACPRLTVQKVDYVRQPTVAQQIKDKYKLTFPAANNEVWFKNLVLFEANGPPKVIHQKELSDYDVTPLLQGQSKEVKRSAFKGEMLFTAALVSVTDSRQRRAAFLTGHREHDPLSDDEVTGYSKLTEVLQQNNLRVDRLSLLGTNRVPEDCELLVIAGPKDQIPEGEWEKIEQYLRQGGRLLALVGPVNDPLVKTGLEKALAEWGIAVGNDLVFDPPNTVTGRDLITTNYSTRHPLARPLLDSRLYLGLPRSVRKAGKNRPDADAPKVEELLFTGEKGVALTDIRGGMGYPGPQDVRGVIPFAVALEKGTVPGVSGDRGATRMVVVGEDRFLSNQMMDASVGNRDFAILAVNWLLDRPQLMGGVGPKPVVEYRLNLTRAQRMAVRWGLIVFLPGGVLLAGGVIWLRRRR